jgi:unsaturated rhamnogalacturonyl hydrolase
MKKVLLTFIWIIFLSNASSYCQTIDSAINDSHVPLHLLRPDYGIPYGELTKSQVKDKTDLILKYLQSSTYARLENAETHREIHDFKEIGSNCQIVRGAFRIASYEWGVTYSGMLKVAEVTDDSAYEKYVTERLGFLSDIAPGFIGVLKKGENIDVQMGQILRPQALDDAGAVCAAMIKTGNLFGLKNKYRLLIENYMKFILEKEIRLDDGTFARNRPFRNTVWLDDMYMSLPAIAQYGIYTKNNRYYDEAAREILLFADKLFVKEKGLFKHGWVQNMEPHPSFHWGRANGWAILTMCDVLDVLPEKHPLRPEILSLLKAHISGIAKLQSGTGFWHQLLDRDDSYLETSCTAIFTYCIAHAINQGWVDATAYGPVALLGWEAVSTKINSEGHVEGTCVGTGLGFDPAYYYHRPVSSSAAHGYGPVLLAGAEIMRLLDIKHPKMNDSAIQFYNKRQSNDNPIFSEE